MNVIFDLDGGLVDTGWAHKQSWYYLAEKEGFSMTDELFYSTFGLQNYKTIPMLIGRDASSSEAGWLSNWKERRLRKLIADKLDPSEGAKSLLCDLKNEDFLLAVGSSAPQTNLELVLASTRLQDHFDAYVTGQNVTNGKPAPDTFLKAAGMPVVAVTTTTEWTCIKRI